MPPTFAVAHLKGGVGKSALACGLVDSMSRQLRATDPHARVLLVDCDPQRGATHNLAGGEVSDTVTATISTLLVGRTTLDETILALDDPETVGADRAALLPGVDLIPASPDSPKVRLAGGSTAFLALRDLLADDRIAKRYGAIGLDTGYGDTDLTALGLVAADGVLGVTSTAHMSTRAVADLINTINEMHRVFSWVELLGFVANAHDPRRPANRANLEDLRTFLGEKLLAVILYRAAVERAADLQVPVSQINHRSRDVVVDCYDRIATRILETLS